MTELAERIAHLPTRLIEILVRRTQVDSPEARKLDAIVPRNRALPVPLSFAQERLWFLEQLQPGNGAYNLPVVLPLGEPLDVTVLQKALNNIVARHEALRTTFSISGGVPVQRIAPSLEVGIEEVTPSEGEAQRVFAEEVARPFDLQRGPLIRAKLIRQGPGGSMLIVNMHHIVSDGWSTGILLRELQELYAAELQQRPPNLEPLRVQYGDFAVWQREWLQGDVLAQQLSWWREWLAGAPALADLPTDWPRPRVETYRGAVQLFQFPARVVEPLRELARESGATLFMVLLAVFNALMWRYTGDGDVVVGSPIANRNRAEMEGLIGFFVNMLALRAQVSGGETVRKLVERVREATLGAYEHQDVPFEKLVAELQPRRSLSHSPVYQVAFVLQNTPEAQTYGDAGEMPEVGLDDEPVYGLGTSKFDLTLSLAERGGGLTGSCEYRTDLFGHRTMGRLVRRYGQMLERAGSDPESLVRDLPVLLPGEPVSASVVDKSVVDEDMRPQAVDLRGEIIGADGARTGLTGRARPDGSAEVLGETARIVRLDGMRADPERLAELLRRHPALAEAAVGVRGAEGDLWLAAWVVPQPGRRVNEVELIDYAAGQLGAALTPRRIFVVESLPSEQDDTVAPLPETEGPRTPAEAVIARIWTEVLKRSQPDVNANFFDAGGNSVTSVQVIARIRESLHVDLPLHRLFEAPTIAELAALVQTDPMFSAETEPKVEQRRPDVAGSLSLADLRLEGLDEDGVRDLVQTLDEVDIDGLLRELVQ